MLYISLNPGVLNYVSASEKEGRQIVEKTGSLPLSSFNPDRTFFFEKGAMSHLTRMLKSLKGNLDYPQTEIVISLPLHLLSLAFHQEIPPDWIDEIRLGRDYKESLRKKNIALKNDGFLSVRYDPRILDLLCKAARYEGFYIKKITPGIINALNVVHMIYKTEQYEKYAILKWDHSYPEVLLFAKDVPVGHLCFHPGGEVPVLKKSGEVNPELPEQLKPATLSGKLYEITGPLFVYATQYPEPDSLKPFRNFGFCEIINPFTGLEVMESNDLAFTGKTDAELSGWTESAGFINRE